MNAYNSFASAKDEVVAVVDVDQLARDAQERGKKINQEKDADAISALIKVIGTRSHRYALVAEQDDRGRKAYQKAGFEIISINGNRVEEVIRFISQRGEALRTGRVRHLVLVTTDTTFTVLAEQADPKATTVSFWAPASSIPRELTLPPYDFRDLDEMLPGSPKVAILIDFENIWFGVKNKIGATPDLGSIIEAIKKVGNEFGEVKKITAYADWELLGKEVQRNIQRELVQMDVDTQYLINIRGKNTADMRVANDMRDMIERGSGGRDDVDNILLATGDRDFRDIVKTAIQRGKKVVIMAVRNGVSSELANIASEVRYIDDYLKQAAKTNAFAENKLPVVRPWTPSAAFILKIANQITGTDKLWVPAEDLDTLGFTDLPSMVQDCVEAGMIARETQTSPDGQPINGIKLNMKNPVVLAITRLLWWAPDRIAYCQRKGMPYVDSAFLAKGFAMDKNFQSWGIGQTRNEANGWLDLLARHGVIVKKTQPHKDTPEHTITTWWLPVSESEPVAIPANNWPTSQPSTAQTEERAATKRTPTDSPISVWQNFIGAPA